MTLLNECIWLLRALNRIRFGPNPNPNAIRRLKTKLDAKIFILFYSHYAWFNRYRLFPRDLINYYENEII